MNIIPAIDLQNKKCVRLFQGNLNKIIIYNENPIEQAKIFENEGCHKLHIIDLDAAINKSEKNKQVIINIKKNVSMNIQLGGGIRSYEQIKFWFDNKIDNLIIGSMAFLKPESILKAINEFPNKIIIAIDDKNNKPMISGWLKEAKINTLDIFKYYEKEKIKGYIFTDINRDGTLLGLDMIKIKNFIRKTKHRVIIGGGLKGIDDIKKLYSLNANNINGVVVGKSYYEGTIKLKEAINLVKNA
tara:strand:- start:631 stop:1359 length:729 start_codon:yes stop_codon:yes gene_type:complete